jgi:hypothetical protein
VSLQAQVAGSQTQTAARVWIRRARVGPISDLNAVDPRTDMCLVGDQRRREPFVIIGDHPAGLRAAIDRPRAGVDWIGAIAVLDCVLNLQLVAVGGLAGRAAHRAKEDAAVEAGAVGPRVELQAKVAPGGVGLEESGAAAGVDCSVEHVELRL